jgi:hypothetical protein
VHGVSPLSSPFSNYDRTLRLSLELELRNAVSAIGGIFVIYLGSFVFAAMAILLVVLFVRKFRQSND